MIYKKINKCRSCDETKLVKLVSLGKQPLANALIKKKSDFKREIRVPLETVICSKCKLVQLLHTVRPNILFKKYLWVTGTSQKVKKYRSLFFKNIQKYIRRRGNFICEIASNDGFFLDYVKKENQVLGIDPANNLAKIARAKKIETWTDFFNEKTSKKIINIKKKKPNLVICRNVIPHIENIKSVMKGLKSLISNDGVGAIEFHNAKKILLDNHYDYIYHEHIFYFTLSSLNNILKKNGLFGFDYFKSPISGGSYVIIFKTKKTTPTQKFLNIIKNEKKQKLDTVKFWQTLRKKCEEHKKKFLQKISNFNKLNIISAYGASARSSTLLNYLQLDHKFITQIFDINLLKKNMYSPGSHIRIKNPTMQNIKSTNIIILLAWNFKEEILKFLKQKNFKGKVFQPLPRIKIFKLR